MLVTIFGAGASFDCDSSEPPQSPEVEVRLRKGRLVHDRPPLANQLFEPRSIFEEVMNDYDQCKPIVALLRAGSGLETRLQEFQEEAKEDHVLAVRLAAVRFYLQRIIYICQQGAMGHTHGVTNQLGLVELMRRRRRELGPACLITFNYDALLEHAMTGSMGLTIQDMPDYIRYEDAKIFKLHGSVNWAHRVITPISGVSEGRTPLDIARELITRISELELETAHRFVSGVPSVSIGETAYFPAIAIPVNGAKDFECPQDHLNELKSCLPRASRLLIIGWRGQEQHFLEMLKHIPAGIPGLIVAGGKADGETIADGLARSGINASWTPAYNGGFSSFLKTGEAEGWLRRRV